MTNVEPDAKQIFLAALDQKTPDERSSFVDVACGDDDDLRIRVDDLLRAHLHVGTLLSGATAPEPTVDGPSISAEVLEQPGTRIGPYKIREQISHGGFGIVYVAEQETPVSRKVALKVIKPGMDSMEIIARFEAERQALAMMDHPNIARVLDAGATDSGRPYFVMELIHGLPITEFCDRKLLTNRTRLSLFVEVCQAVQHAHQRGIIHRDLKPSNILVTMHDDKAVPKVIDFGVAKALNCRLTDHTVYTLFGQMLGTPLYMSPEQVQMSGLDLDTRSDVYSLGVLLYELLTGETPFDKETLRQAGLDELRRMIGEDEPLRPSDRVSTLNAKKASTASHNRGVDQRTLRQSLRGELDWIVGKALEKDRKRRYDSASALADDISRHLADLPIQASPPSTMYRIKKYVRRNKGNVVLGSVVLAALIAVVGVVAGGLGWAARDKTMREAKSHGEIDIVLAEVKRYEDLEQWPQALAALKRAESVVAAGQVDTDTRVRVERCVTCLTLVRHLEEARMEINVWERDRAYTRIFTDLDLNIDTMTTTDLQSLIVDRPQLTSVLASHLTVWAIARKRLAKEGYERTWDHLLDIAEAVDSDPLHHRTLAVLRQGGGAREAALQDLLKNHNVQQLSASATVLVGGVLLEDGKTDEAIQLLQQSLYIYPDDFWLNDALAISCREARPRRTSQSVQYFRVALGLRPESSRAWNNLGVALRDDGSTTEAIACCERAIEIDPDYSAAYGDLGIYLAERGEQDEAIRLFQKAIEKDPYRAKPHRNLAKAYHDGGNHAESVASYKRAVELDPNNLDAYIHLANVLLDQGEAKDAEEWLQEALNVDPDHALTHHELGNVHARQGDYKAATDFYKRSIVLDPGSPQGHFSLGNMQRLSGNMKAAINSYRQSLDRVSFLDPSVRAERTGQIQFALGAVHQLSGSDDEAIDCFQKAIEQFSQATQPNCDMACAQAHLALGQTLVARGTPEEAVAYFQQAIGLVPNDARPHVNLGFLLQSLGRGEEAEQYFEKVRELQPDWSAQARHLADRLVSSGRVREAVDCYQRAIAVEPEFGPAYTALGKILFGQGQHKQAVLLFTKAIELAPKDAAGYRGLARALIYAEPNSRDCDGALKMARRAIELDPTDAVAWELLSVGLYRIGQWQEALDAREKKIEQTAASVEDKVYQAMIQWQLGEHADARSQFKLIQGELTDLSMQNQHVKELLEEAQKLFTDPGDAKQD